MKITETKLRQLIREELEALKRMKSLPRKRLRARKQWQLSLQEQERIYNAVRDCTVGSGNDSEQPSDDDMKYIAYCLHTTVDEFTDEQLQAINAAWSECLQDMGQP